MKYFLFAIGLLSTTPLFAQTRIRMEVPEGVRVKTVLPVKVISTEEWNKRLETKVRAPSNYRPFQKQRF